MGVPMTLYRCKKCGCGVRRETRSGRPSGGNCSRGGQHEWVVERKE